MSLTCTAKTLTAVLLVLVGWALLSNAEERFQQGQPIKEFEVIQKEVFCTTNNKAESNQCSRMNYNYLKFFLSVFLVIAWGGAVRTVIKTFELSIPYTVVLLITGLLVGLGARVNVHICEKWTQYTKFARTPPELILYIFLPILIFESAYSMKAHVFFRSFVSISVVALPGMLITTLVTALGCKQFMSHYNWTFAQAALFGSIISATDPVAVVAILKELGTSESLSVMIEGESLLNDGVAILLYEILKDVVENPDSEEDLVSTIALRFLQIAVGGPTFGFVMGKLTIMCLSLIFNDAATEITITLVSAYLTYFVGEFYLGVSGVMAVVLLGVTISATNTCISPEVEHVVHQFWDMMSFFANTVLFVILGIVISETAINSFDKSDGYYVIWLYFTLNIIRLMMILLLSPILSRTGYGINWRDLIVMVWGGLRGAVGVCLALEVYKNKKLCLDFDKVGSKFLLLTAGIVILTLLVNGSTTKYLLDSLGVTAISIGKLQDMGNAVKTITSARVRTITALKHDRFLADANWEVVHKFTHLKDPYAKKHKVHDEKTKKLFEWRMENLKKSPALLTQRLVTEGSLSTSVVKLAANTTKTGAPGAPVNDKWETDSIYHTAEMTSKGRSRISGGVHHTNPFGDRKSSEIGDDKDDALDRPFNEFKAIMEESRLRVLKAMKISCWKQYERGYLSEEAVKLLVSEIEGKEDVLLTMVHTEDLRDHWGNKGLFLYLQKSISEFMVGQEVGTAPKSVCRKLFYHLTGSVYFHIFIYIVIVANLVPICYTLALLIRNSDGNPQEKAFIFWTTVIFAIIYLLEFIFKIIGRGCGPYFESHLNQLDFVVLVLCVVETVFSIYGEVNPIAPGGKTANGVSVLKILRVVRFIRLLRAFRPLMPVINRILEYRVNAKLFMGYDVGKGYIQALEDALRFLPHMIENKRIARKFKSVLDSDRLATTKELGLLQLAHPGVVIAVKTRHASRSICNQMRDDLEDLRVDGLLGEKEYVLLTSKIELNLKKLWASPSSVKPVAPETLINNISWTVGNENLLNFLKENAVEKCYPAGYELYRLGESPRGIHMIIDGLVRLHYEPTDDTVSNFRGKGILPNTEFVLDLTFSTPATDYMGTGAILGELGVLTNLPRASSIVCETNVTLFHWSQQTMERGLHIFDEPYDSLESRLWRSYGIKVAAEYLHTQNAYSSWTQDKIRAHLEQATVPSGIKYEPLEITAIVDEAILIFGEVLNTSLGEALQAPAVIPKIWGRLHPADENLPYKLHPKVLILAEEESVREIMESGSLTSLEKCILHSPGMALNLADEHTEVAVEDATDTTDMKNKEKSLIIVRNNLALRRHSSQDSVLVIQKTGTTLRHP